MNKAFLLNLTLILEAYEDRRLENFLALTGMTREMYELMSRIPW